MSPASGPDAAGRSFPSVSESGSEDSSATGAGVGSSTPACESSVVEDAEQIASFATSSGRALE